jgi:ATP-binding cassette subfamily B protein
MDKKTKKTPKKAFYIKDIPRTPLRFLFHVLAQYPWAVTCAIVIVIFASALSQATSYFFKLIVDASEVGDTSAVILYALLYPVAIFLVQLLYRFSGFFGGYITLHAKAYTNDILVRYVLNHSHKYFSDRFSGSLLSKLGNVSGAVDQFIPDLLWTHISAVVSFGITAVFIFRADALSGIFFIVLVVVLIFTNRLLAKRKKAFSFRYAELGSKVRGTIVDIFTNVAATRQYVRTRDEIDRVQTALREHRQAGIASWNFTEFMLTGNTLILFTFSIAIFYLLVGRWSAGDIGTGDFVFLLSLYAQITGTLLFIGRAFNNTARSFGEMEEGLTEILQPYEIVDQKNAATLTVEEGTIHWKNVSFEYGEQKVFDDFNLTIPKGQRVGLVGTSGAGKTTFVSLLLRQHDVMSGAIMIDGQNIAAVTQDSLREHIAVVPQEPMLFHRSIRENILYGKPDATEDELVEVAKKAQAHDFIMALPEGYSTLVGERGVKLSGGQKQRVAIARAMLKNSRILVLDEATSALDSESEVAIQKALHELMEGKTVIAIAHRLSTLREMDRIIVLEQGKIVEDGTHDTLTKAGGIYARLWEHQAGGFLIE